MYIKMLLINMKNPPITVWYDNNFRSDVEKFDAIKSHRN